jgi:hypothetical protein
MRKPIQSAISLFFLIMISASHSASATTVIGLEDMSCRAWTASKSSPDARKANLAWVRGFLTGHNYARPDQQVSALSSGTVENFIDRYCSENPNELFTTAAMRMSDRFSGRNKPPGK